MKTLFTKITAKVKANACLWQSQYVKYMNDLMVHK